MYYKLIILVIISGFISSCGNSNIKTIGVQTDTVSHAEHHHDEVIVLNNGVKWKVDTAMMLHIRNMESDINTYATDKQKDYQALALKLQNNIDLLTSNCTMKGRAHDELHKWLLPYIDLVNEFSLAKNGTEAAKLFQKLQHSFGLFNKYFE